MPEYGSEKTHTLTYYSQWRREHPAMLDYFIAESYHHHHHHGISQWWENQVTEMFQKLWVLSFNSYLKILTYEFWNLYLVYVVANNLFPKKITKRMLQLESVYNISLKHHKNSFHFSCIQVQIPIYYVQLD